MKYISQHIFKDFLKGIFRKIDCPEEICSPVMSGLIETSLRGVDSHGLCLIPHYVKAALSGRVNIHPHFQWKQTSATTANLDADHTFGITAASLAMDKAMDMARLEGIGMVIVANSSHFGAAAIYSLKAARRDMIGISMTNVDALVLPYGGKDPYLGTNPISFAAPCQGEEPFCLDMATSMISWNKLRQHRAAQMPLKSGWAADKDGRQTLDASQAHALLPIGDYKGYGLALMIEILCSLLTGMPFGKHVQKMYPVDGAKRRLGHLLMAIDISRFQEPDIFKSRIKILLDELRSQPPAHEFDKVRVANDPEKQAYVERTQKGIPLTAAELKNFKDLMTLLKMDVRKYPF